jgi:hypothetical protein
VLIDKSDRVLGLSSSLQLVETYLYLKLLFFNSDFQAKKQQEWSISKNYLRKSLFLYMKKLKSEERADDFKKVFSDTISINFPSNEGPFLLKALLSQNELSISTIILQVKEIISFFKILEPLPPLKGKKDKEGALKVLGLNPGSSKEQIKKQYKSLAKLKHPDRLKAKGISEEFDQKATENFTQIQKAYDILMK